VQEAVSPAEVDVQRLRALLRQDGQLI
jgi:hypothetical protein